MLLITVAPTAGRLGDSPNVGDEAGTTPVVGEFDQRPGWLLIGGAAGVAVGSLGPWATVQAGIFSVTKNGIDGDGVITLLLAFALGVVGFPALRAVMSRGQAISATIIGVATVALCIYEIADLSGRVDVGEPGEGFSIEVTVGWGLWLTTVAAVVATIGGALAIRSAAK